jgi:GTP-binding protein
LAEIVKRVSALPKIAPEESFTSLEEAIDKNAFEINQHTAGEFVVTGPLVDNLARGVVLTDTESRGYFHRRLEKSGVIDALRERGMRTGDTVVIADTEFVWEE